MADPLAPFEITLFQKVYTLNPRKDLEIETDEIGEQLTTQPTMYAYYSVIADEAQNTLEAWQVALQQKESELYDRLEEELGKSPSEDKAKKYIRGHEEYHQIQEEIVNAGMIAAKMRSLTNAFVDRRFCLIAAKSKDSSEQFHGGPVTLRSTPKPLAVSDYRGVGAHPSKNKKG